MDDEIRSETRDVLPLLGEPPGIADHMLYAMWQRSRPSAAMKGSHSMSAPLQITNHVRTDETGSADYQNFHAKNIR